MKEYSVGGIMAEREGAGSTEREKQYVRLE